VWRAIRPSGRWPAGCPSFAKGHPAQPATSDDGSRDGNKRRVRSCGLPPRPTSSPCSRRWHRRSGVALGSATRAIQGVGLHCVPQRLAARPLRLKAAKAPRTPSPSTPKKWAPPNRLPPSPAAAQGTRGPTRSPQGLGGGRFTLGGLRPICTQGPAWCFGPQRRDPTAFVGSRRPSILRRAAPGPVMSPTKHPRKPSRPGPPPARLSVGRRKTPFKGRRHDGRRAAAQQNNFL